MSKARTGSDAATAGSRLDLHLDVAATLPTRGPGEREVFAAAAAQGLAMRGMAELYQDPVTVRQGLLIGYGAPSERAYPAALDALAGTLCDAGVV